MTPTQATNGKRTVLVTGAAGGIGRVLVRRLGDAGWRVFAGVRSPASAAELPGPGITPIQFDVCDEGSVLSAASELEQTISGGGLQGLVNLAGLSVDGPIELVSLPDLRRQFETNVIGQLAVIKALLPLLRAGKGRIVNVGGAAGRMPMPLYGGLSASKAALDAFTQVLRMELKHQDVKVVYVEPGAVQTGFFRRSAKAARQSQDFSQDERQRIYAAAIEAATAAMLAARAMPVSTVVDVIVKALASPGPAARYVVGADARLGLAVLRHLPAAVRDRVLLSTLKLGAGSFAAPASDSCLE